MYVRPMNRRALWTVSLLVGTVSIGLAGCGGPSEEELARAKKVATERKEKAAEARLERIDDVAEGLAADRKEACEASAEDLVDAASELQSRLNVGLNYSDYVDKVADVRVAYDRIDFDEAEAGDLECIQEVGLRLERAMNEYSAAARSWGTCVESYSCDEDDNTRRLQSRWDKAGQQIGAAETGLDNLGEVDEALTELATTQVDEEKSPTGATTPE